MFFDCGTWGSSTVPWLFWVFTQLSWLSILRHNLMRKCDLCRCIRHSPTKHSLFFSCTNVEPCEILLIVSWISQSCIDFHYKLLLRQPASGLTLCTREKIMSLHWASRWVMKGWWLRPDASKFPRSLEFQGVWSLKLTTRLVCNNVLFWRGWAPWGAFFSLPKLFWSY